MTKHDPDAQWVPPPNWPRPPTWDWRPPPGWKPDKSWGPAPKGWQFWVTPAPEDASYGRNPKPPASSKDIPAAARAALGLFVLVLLFVGASEVIDLFRKTNSFGLTTTGHPVLKWSGGDRDAYLAVDQAVYDKHKDAPWWDEIEEIRKPLVGDGFLIATTLDDENPQEIAYGIEMCEAYRKAAAPGTPIYVSGRVFYGGVEVDGSKSDDSRPSDMAKVEDGKCVQD
jgi:hypothetical protein